MKEVSLVSRINSGVKNPNITVILDINFDDYEVKFYSGEEIKHECLDISVIPSWKNLTQNSKAFTINPPVLKKTYVEVSSGGEVVSRIKIRNSILSTLKCKVVVAYNSKFKNTLRVLSVKKMLIKMLPKKYRQDAYNRILDVLIKRNNNLLATLNQNNIYEYNYWINNFEKFSEVIDYEFNPKISVVIPVYNCPIVYLRECIDSILNQTYQNFEVCLCDDASTDKEVVKVLKEYEEKDSRIKVFYSKENGHISKATNNAISIATGDFIAFMDNDDTISPYAFNEVIKVLNEDKSVEFIYSDEDKMNMDGVRLEPNFKPDFSAETLLGINYICHLVVVKKTLVDQVNGIREGYEGVQDHDFLLRITELTNNIAHIPKILYHWRMIPGSTAVDVSNKSYVSDNGVKMVKDTLKRRGLSGEVFIKPPGSAYSTILGNDGELVSIIIPTRDGAKILRTCLESVYEKSTYKNFEVIVVDNGSEKAETFELFEEFKNYDNFRVLRLECEFNYSYLNNEAVKIANGEYVLLLNNDIEVISPNWLEAMLGHARIQEVGAVGAMLYYPNDTVQHCGVTLGIGGVAGHCFTQLPRTRISELFSGRVPTNYSAVTAACLMINKEKFIEVGMLNETDLKVAFNDVEFCIRVAQKGYRNLITPEAELYHHESISRGYEDTYEKRLRFNNEVLFMLDGYPEIISKDPMYNTNFSKFNPYQLKVCDEHHEKKVFDKKYRQSVKL